MSALNTPPERASARVFANVLRDTLGGDRAASDLLLPKADLGALFPAPAAAFVAARGGEIRLGAAVRGIARDGAGFRLDADPDAFSHVVVACPPQLAPALLGGLPELGELAATLAAIEHEPIYTCYLQYPDAVSLPFPMLGFSGGLAAVGVRPRDALRARGPYRRRVERFRRARSADARRARGRHPRRARRRAARPARPALASR